VVADQLRGLHQGLKETGYVEGENVGAAAWPITTYAQQPDGQPRIGVLMTVGDGPQGQARMVAFRQGLQQLGWTDGRNIRDPSLDPTQQYRMLRADTG
jgi:hypothetical protein